MLDFFIINMYDKLKDDIPKSVRDAFSNSDGSMELIAEAAEVAVGTVLAKFYLALPKDLIITSCNRSVSYEIDQVDPTMLDQPKKQATSIQELFYKGFSQDILNVSLRMVSGEGFLSLQNLIDIVIRNVSLSFFEWTIMIDGVTYTHATLSGISTSKSNVRNALDYQLTFNLIPHGLKSQQYGPKTETESAAPSSTAKSTRYGNGE